MSEFDDMISRWKSQPVPPPQSSATEVAQKAKARIAYSRKKHIATIVVLGITLAVLIAFALYTTGSGSHIAKGIQLMMGALLIRIGVEWLSMMLLNKVDITKETTEYLKMLTSFYNTRRKIHGAFTYIIFGLYAAGFGMMLPIFKETLSSGFFTYICVSGAVIFVALLYYINKKIRQELEQLERSISELESIKDTLEE